MSTHRLRRVIIDDFPSITLADMRRALGGRRRFRAAARCRVELGEGRAVEVELVEQRANMVGPTGAPTFVKVALCPTCRRPTTSLRVVPFGSGLCCRRDLVERLDAKYRSQVRRGEAARVDETVA